jgi:hypothetical protein
MKSFITCTPHETICSSQGGCGAGRVSRMGENRNDCRILVAKPEGKRLLGRPRRRWVDSIKIYLGGIG